MVTNKPTTGHLTNGHVFLTSEDCARCGSICGRDYVFCVPCKVEAAEWRAMREVS